jgi:site-specific recombinase XerD
LYEFLDDPGIEAVTSDDIRRFLAHERERGLSPHTVKRQYATYHTLFVWLVETGLVTENPVSTLPTPKLPRVPPKALSGDEVNTLMSAIPQMARPRRAKAIVTFILETGARASELCGVRMPHVCLKTGKVLLVETKGGHNRHVHLHKVAREALWAYIHTERGEPLGRDDHVFLSIHQRPLNRDSLRNIVYRLAENAGIKCSPHQLRHTSAIMHLRNGSTLVHIQHLLGHRSIETTRKYLTALSDDDVREATKLSSPCDNLML